MAAFWLTAIDNAAAPAVAMIDEPSCAVTLMPAPLPSVVVSVLPLRTRASVLLRILLRPTEPARLTPMAEPLPEPATLPAAPMPSAKMLAVISALTVMGPPAVTCE